MKFSLEEPMYPNPVYPAAIRALMPRDAKNYSDALQTVIELFTIEKDAVRMLRAAEPDFHKMTARFIQQRIPSVSLDLAERLTERRVMRPLKPSRLLKKWVAVWLVE